MVHRPNIDGKLAVLDVPRHGKRRLLRSARDGTERLGVGRQDSSMSLPYLP
jgi:hypothetical protein